MGTCSGGSVAYLSKRPSCAQPKTKTACEERANQQRIHPSLTKHHRAESSSTNHVIFDALQHCIYSVQQHSRVGRIQQRVKKYSGRRAKLFSPITSTFSRMMRVFPRTRWDMSAHPRPRMRELCLTQPPSTLSKTASNCLIWYSQIYSVHDEK